MHRTKFDRARMTQAVGLYLPLLFAGGLLADICEIHGAGRGGIEENVWGKFSAGINILQFIN